MESVFAKRVLSLQASAIREIFKLIGQSDIISFAGGSPAPELFPSKELAEISADILNNQGAVALQYNITEGYAPLVNLVRERMSKINVGTDLDDLIITSGAQQAIDLAAKVLVNEGDTVVVENPSFIGTLNSLRSYDAKLVGVDMEDDGMNINQLEEILKNQKVKFIYTIPTFQNPSGTTLSLEKRKKLLELAKKYDTLILEDNPYGELRFSGEEIPTIKSMDTEGRVIYVGSFSKILSPGLRLGWVVCRKDILERIVVCKQVNDVHTNIFSQMLATEYMKRHNLDEHIGECQKLYGEKCKAMLEAMDKYFPSFCTYTRPEGGIFILCTMPKEVDTKKLLQKAIERKVAYVPGNPLVIDIDKPSNIFRLNYSNATIENIEKGIKILGEVFKEEIK